MSCIYVQLFNSIPLKFLNHSNLSGTMMKTQNKLFSTSVLLSAMLASMPLLAVEKGDILLDVRVLNISPNVNDNQIMAGGAPLAPPAGIDVDSANSLGIDITYMVTNNFGIELMLDTTSTHDIKGKSVV